MVSSIILLLTGLSVACFVLFGATLFAIWLRKHLVWSPVGRRLVGLGLPDANGTINDLQKGRRYVVRQRFDDYHGNRFEVGEGLTFRRADYLSYHGGHTVFFDERTIYLHEEDQADVVQRIWAYLEPAPDVARGSPIFGDAKRS